jgi:hypothetical protein
MIEDYSPKKILVEKQVFHEIDYNKPFTWKDIKHIDFQDDDVIRIEYVDAFHSENNGWDGHYSCTVTRMVEETDEQYEQRRERIKWDKKWSRERQFQNYCSLKKKFENACPYCGIDDNHCTDVESESCENLPKEIKKINLVK